MSLNQILEEFRIGSYTSFNPQKIDDVYHEVHSLLNSRMASLSNADLYDLLHYEFILALMSNRDSEARIALQRIVDKFTEKPQRVGLLRSMYIEATEGPDKAREYLTSRPPSDIIALKRSAVLEKANGDIKAYITALLKIVDILPTDPETWAELAEAYVETGNYSKALHSLEEVTLIQPYAYNVFGRMGEINHIMALTRQNIGEQLTILKDSVKYYGRAVEISPNYVRGWSGILVVVNKLSSWPKLGSSELKEYEELDQIARKRLMTIIKKELSTKEDILAAKKLMAV